MTSLLNKTEPDEIKDDVLYFIRSSYAVDSDIQKTDWRLDDLIQKNIQKITLLVDVGQPTKAQAKSKTCFSAKLIKKIQTKHL